MAIVLLAVCDSQSRAEAQIVTHPKVSAHSVNPGVDQQVEVKITEFKIEMPATIAAGSTTFTVTNTGGDRHGFEIEGNGMEKQLATPLQAGQTKTLRVELEPGTYEVYCPVEGHKMLGMSRTLTVR